MTLAWYVNFNAILTLWRSMAWRLNLKVMFYCVLQINRLRERVKRERMLRKDEERRHDRVELRLAPRRPREERCRGGSARAAARRRSSTAAAAAAAPTF